MKMTIDLPLVGQCSVSNCAYNASMMCHAKAITIGDDQNPCCDTMMRGSRHVHANSIKAGVGACKVSSCGHNDDLECSADKIAVGMSGGNIKCMTYAMR